MRGDRPGPGDAARVGPHLGRGRRGRARRRAAGAPRSLRGGGSRTNPPSTRSSPIARPSGSSTACRPDGSPAPTVTTSRRTARSAESSAEGAPVVHPSVGPTDSIVDVPGLRVGQVEIGPMPSTPAGSTGVTAIVAPAGALGAVDVRGAAPGTRETDTLSVLTSGEQVHAILLVGRSVFGLAATDGATAELERRGIGLPVDCEDLHLTIPIVAAAVVFDFAHG
ncbi:MAG: hypothetical protein E6I94_10825, partial [Chloroflexi bacterium]